MLGINNVKYGRLQHFIALRHGSVKEIEMFRLSIYIFVVKNMKPCREQTSDPIGALEV